MLKDLTVLLSASDSPSMPGMIDCLRSNGERKIRTVGVDMSSEPSAKYIVDSFYKVPAATDPQYCDMMLDICRKEKVDIYFPTISAEVSTVSKRKAEFDAIGTKLSISDPKAVAIANNKLKAYAPEGVNINAVLEEAGIDPGIRAQNMTAEQFRTLYTVWRKTL